MNVRELRCGGSLHGARSHGAGSHGVGSHAASIDNDGFDAADIETLMTYGVSAAMAGASGSDPKVVGGYVDHMIELESRRTSPSLTGACAAYADTVLNNTVERGWQPAELMHVVTRRADKACIPLAMALLGAHSRRTKALSTAPEFWRDQLLDLGVDVGTDLVNYRRSAVRNAREFWSRLFQLLAHLHRLPTMVAVGPPPSSWGAEPSAGPDARPNSKVLNTIRGLLAKAESSTFDAEAETFSAKAQELMTRYAIDVAVLDSASFDGNGGHTLNAAVVSRRLIVENPYPDAKMQLLAAVAASNGARTVFYAKFGLVAITGMPVDLDLCELLYTSLLVQASRALENAGIDQRTRSRGFRRAFLLGYAWRIRERLAEARSRADRAAGATYGNSLVPVLANRDKAVSEVFDELYPNLRLSKTTVSDRSGISQGRAAAERADLTGGRERIEN